MDSQANCYKCKGTYCTNPELQMPVIMRDGTVYCYQCTISEFDRLQEENSRLKGAIDKICEPAIRDRGTEWSRVGQEITAMESLGNIYLYLDSQKQEQPQEAINYFHHTYKGGSYVCHKGLFQDCPICNPKLLHPCPDCTWGQCKVEYGRGIDKQNIVVFEPCPTCKGKRVIEEKGG